MALSFRNKLTLFLVLTLVTVQVLTAVMVMGFTRSALIDQGKGELASATALFARQLDVRAAQLAEGVQILALDFPLRQAIATRDTATALSAMRNHGRRIGATRMLLVGLDGQVVVENDERAGAAPAMTGAFPFASLLETAAVEGIASSLVVLGGRAYWLVTVPVLAPVPIAFVAAGIPLDDALVADLQTLSALPRSIALLTQGADGRWTIAARTEAAPSDPFHLVAGGTSMAEGVNLVEREGTERLVLRQPLEVPPGSPHVLAVLEFSLAEALDPYRPILGALTLLLIGGLVAALFGTLLIARSVTRPVEALSAVARRIAKGDYTPPPPLPQKDELGQLADALGTMAHAIGEREEKIRHQASHDVVTGLPNRTALADRIDGAIATQAGQGSAGQGSAGALLLVGLERLQEIVNTLGHAVGDRLVRGVAEQLSAAAAGRGIVGRVGDLAFALWLPGADGAAAEVMAGDLRRLLEMPQQDGDLSVDLGAAIGLALHPDHGETADLLMQHAEVAMFTAQRSTTRFRLYDPATDPHRPERLSLMGDLRDAIAADDLRLFYQPKLHLADGRIAGAEGLVRWTHAKRGFVPPDSFIPLAEQTGTIRLLTDWALRTGVAQAAAWAAAGLDIRASINTSARDLNDPALPDRLQALMDGAGIGPDRIVLEVTESAIMDDPEEAVAILRRLADRGIELSIDDFGVGQSSLAYMRRLPVAELKIDKSFVLKLASSPPDRTIVAAVMRLAHGFNCRVTAEGVEDAESLAILRDLGCDYAQGYHIARPMPSDKFAEFLATGPWQPARIGVAA